MAWDEWERLKAEAADHRSAPMQLNQVPPEPSGGGGSQQGDLAVNQTDLAAIGDAAFELHQGFGRVSEHARAASQKAAGGLKTQGFALGGALDHVASRWIDQSRSLLDATAHISNQDLGAEDGQAGAGRARHGPRQQSPWIRRHEQPHAVRRLRRPVPQRLREKLVAYDKERNVKNMSPWINNWNNGDLNFYSKNDRGRDPMTGFLEALGHNPGAATDFFAQPEGAGAGVDKESELNENLKYLTKDRIWLSDAYIMGGDDKVIAGHDSLGHALEAATTGYVYDADPMTAKDPMIPGNRDMRTAETAGVMEQVVFLYGSEDGPKMLHEQSQLADSLGRMGAAYIDDIDYSMSGVGDLAKDDGLFPPKYQGRADFGEQGAINFLSVIGQNETSHGAVSAAQHLYTLSMLDAHPPTSEANMNKAHDALTTGGEVRGILDHSRVQQAEETYKDEAEEQNKSLGRSGDWVKLGAGAVVGGGIAAIPLPGSTAAALVVAPLAAETIGNAVNTFIGHEIDKGIDKAEEDPTEKAQVTSQQFYSQGIQQQADAYAIYIGADSDVKNDTNLRDWPQDIENSYFGTGSQQNDYRGRPAYKD
ncbi:hypothetical protein [Streptomyces rubiginosohelvolus]|uniref:hypothetical protein n=1 Tax=Streptomyces rubiginosohelvolus TaxID=67362 RepID=UPI0035E11E6D